MHYEYTSGDMVCSYDPYYMPADCKSGYYPEGSVWSEYCLSSDIKADYIKGCSHLDYSYNASTEKCETPKTKSKSYYCDDGGSLQTDNSCADIAISAAEPAECPDGSTDQGDSCLEILHEPAYKTCADSTSTYYSDSDDCRFTVYEPILEF
ncbi:hypothetical protein K0504_18060 [Neiella marina]|uniref:Chitin-binding type-2 domain-containing protein n=1 Tax=Neiella holothuriorum TaxID=2870530 RepID=A0ABS7EKU8_9GAMM|nr:hypothetical protein [Neiella holothuriorum]MBW8192940.1 hypothetical protein [Neiella holothuriorum]